MTDDKIFCPNCKEWQPFQRVEKYVRKFELSRNDMAKIYVVECEYCHHPIGVYPAKEGE